MPELPEVETTCRGLAKVLEGRELVNVQLFRQDLRFPFPENLKESLLGKKILRVLSKAKYLCLFLDNDLVLVMHLGMSGRMIIRSLIDSPSLHDHVIFDTHDGVRVFFNDPRRFGLLTLMRSGEMDSHKLFKKLGPEPLEENFTGEVLSEALKGRNTSIKSALLNQQIVCGLGNIYVCEALFRAGISPRRIAKSIKGVRAQRLVSSIKDVLSEAILAGGSSMRDYLQPSGELGYFKYSWNVYGRNGELCVCCMKLGLDILIKKITQSGRSTFYCSRCQR